MKKTILFIAMICAITMCRAQFGSEFGVNTFINVNGGLNIYHSERGGTKTGSAVNLSIGKWVLDPFAFRVDFGWITNNSNRMNPDRIGNFYTGNAEFLWDFMQTFDRRRHSRWHIYPMVGLGFIIRDSIEFMPGENPNNHGLDRDFEMLFGGNLLFDVYEGFGLTAEYKLTFLPNKFDGGISHVRMHFLTAGAQYRFKSNHHVRRTRHESRDLDEDWFMGFGVGPNISVFDLRFDHLCDQLGITPELFWGRNFSSLWTLRIGFSGLMARQLYNEVTNSAREYRYTHLHADMMINIAHIFHFQRGDKWSVLPYAGCGPIWRYDNLDFDLAADAGIMGRRYLNSDGDFYVDAHYTMVTPRIAGSLPPSGRVTGSGQISLTFGYIHNFGLSSTRYRLRTTEIHSF